MSSWKPIDTAPKRVFPGKPIKILACVMKDGQPDHVRVVAWGRTDTCDPSSERWLGWGWAGFRKPTHWAETPDLPTQHHPNRPKRNRDMSAIEIANRKQALTAMRVFAKKEEEGTSIATLGLTMMEVVGLPQPMCATVTLAFMMGRLAGDSLDQRAEAAIKALEDEGMTFEATQ